LLQLLILLALGSVPDEAVLTIRIETAAGCQLATATAISPRHLVTLAPFATAGVPYLEDEAGVLSPEALLPDLGLAILSHEEDVFDSYVLPSEDLPPDGESLVLVGQGRAGRVRTEGRVLQRQADGTYVLSTDRMEGMMGAAAFTPEGNFVGVVTGLSTVARSSGYSATVTERLVILPSQIWQLWARLSIFGERYEGPSFGVTAIAYASRGSVPSGVHLLAVEPESRAWECGLRPGDLIVHADDMHIYHPLTLRGLLITARDTLDLSVRRGSRGSRTVKVPPASRTES
jgi:hypothetical protein